MRGQPHEKHGLGCCVGRAENTVWRAGAHGMHHAATGLAAKRRNMVATSLLSGRMRALDELLLSIVKRPDLRISLLLRLVDDLLGELATQRHFVFARMREEMNLD